MQLPNYGPIHHGTFTTRHCSPKKTCRFSQLSNVSRVSHVGHQICLERHKLFVTQFCSLLSHPVVALSRAVDFHGACDHFCE